MPEQPHSPVPDSNEYVAQRRANRDGVVALGLSPYGQSTPGLISLDKARAKGVPVLDEGSFGRLLAGVALDDLIGA